MKVLARQFLYAAAVGFLVVGQASAADLRIGIAVEPTSADPHYHNLSPNNAFAAHIYNGLIDQDENQRLVPGLAVSWKPINDTTWEFKLRPNVTFHDGSPFTADDVVFTFERAPSVPNSPSSFGLYTKGKQVRKVDDLTVHMVTESPSPLLPNDVSNIYVVSKKVAGSATTGDFNQGKAAIGTGPYRLVEWIQGDRAVLKRNEQYWGEKPAFDNVTIKPIKSDPARVAALLAGDVDLIENVPTADIERLKKEKNVSLYQGVSNRIIYLHLDHFRDKSPYVTGAEKNPLRDLRVRQALSKAINREAIVARVMEGVAIPAGQLLPDTFFGVSKNLKAEKYDPDGAKKLLADAGYPKGFGLTLHAPNGRYINDAKIAQAVGQMLSRVGIATQVETLPPSIFFTRASSGGPNKEPEFSLILVGWGSGTGEASSPLRSLLMTSEPQKGNGASNRGRYSNPEVDKLIDEALGTLDDARREQLLARATEAAIGDLGVIPLHYQVNVWGARKGIKYTPRTDEATQVMNTSLE